MKVVNARCIIETDLSKERVNDMLCHIERSARTCYKSDGKVGEHYDPIFLKGIIKRGHESVLEHAVVSVRFFVDRGVSHEIVRHRIASFSQESTRYCNYSEDKTDTGINFVDIRPGMELDNKMKDLSCHLINEIFNEWFRAMEDAETHYNRMIKMGATPQIARSVLPNSTKTEIVVTANLREWRKIFSLRADTPAHPQMRELMIPLLQQFKYSIPCIFDDILV